SARKFAQWLISSDGQKAIGKFRINGEVLFVPSAK
ncbi:MAG: ABC-type tungstate transport system permease subunit, partial [Oceanospirillaceae bacterium]